jgi:predicted hydrocarbon binding protein
LGKKENFKTSSPNEKSELIRNVINRIDKYLEDDKKISLLHSCNCMSKAKIERGRKLLLNCNNIDSFLEVLPMLHIAGTGMRKEKDYHIILYDKCYCGMVKKTKQPIPKIFCNCSRGYLKDFFEGVFEKEIQLEIIDTVINGANECTFRLLIPNEIKQNV